MTSGRAIIRNIISDLYFFQNCKQFLISSDNHLFNELLFPLILFTFRLPEKAGCCLNACG